MALERKTSNPTEKELREIETKKEIEFDNNQVLNLKLHERCWVRHIQKDVLRVQSGWIYGDWDNNNDIVFNSVFVLDTRN